MNAQVVLSKKANILIADDTAANLRLLSTILETNGYRVYEAPDGKTALSKIRELRPDLVLLDIRMPGMDGYDVCRQLKVDASTHSIPVIFVSALDEQMDKVQGFAVGGVDYITKPFQTKEILARIETHLTLRNLQRQLESQNLLLQQEIAERKRAEFALQKINEELEHRVRERTAELILINESLNNELQERKRAEEALRQSQIVNEALLVQVRKQEQQMREIMNAVPQGVLLVDSEGWILQANPVAQADLAKFLGLAEGDQIVSMGEKSLTEILQSPPEGLWHETTIQGRVFEMIARPTIHEGGHHRWVMVLRDVTNEREIQARSQQEERLAAVGQLAAGIAHDFNNILAVIQLYAEMALGAPEITARLRERLLTILQQARRASDLIQQILDFSRRTMLERRPVDLLPFLKEQVKLLERTLPENIKIDFSLKHGTFTVNADPTRMQQAIMNLAVNARDAMSEGGKLTFEIERLKPDHSIRCVACENIIPGEWIAIHVSDTGEGISSQVLPHIFEPFFTTKALGQGTGLGLSQVFGIIEQHDGHIDVTSTPNLGARFSIYLPALPVKSYTEHDTDTSSFIRGQGQRLLIVEDEPATRQALMEGLSLLNYQVICSPDGSQALAYLHTNPNDVDLVLSDVVMPEMGGVALLKTLRQEGFEIPIILMTGHPLQNELDKMMGDGLTAWLMKPPRLKQLAKLIGEALIESTSNRNDFLRSKPDIK